MKKFIIIAVAIVLLFVFGDFLYWRMGWYLDIAPDAQVLAESRIENGMIQRKNSEGVYEDFEIRGVNLGASMPGSWSIDFATDQETYLRWFSEIEALGANTVRVYTVMSDVFYNAFYEFNQTAETPLYLIQGVSIHDDAMSSRHDIFSETFYDSFYDHCKIAVDVIHGVKKISEKQIPGMGYGTYTKDVSAWVIGYVFGTDWDPLTVAYANDIYADEPRYSSYQGEYLITSEKATPFEAMLASIGDAVISYESKRYKEQRVFAFTGSPETDPFMHTEAVRTYFSKCARVDVENIIPTEKVISGQFASYHVYPYYPDYLNYYEDDEWQTLGIGEKELYATEDGKTNTYLAYLKMLTNHHEMPVVIAEFGVPSSYGISQIDVNTGRNQGNHSEKEQGEAIVSCYRDIMEAGCVGSVVAAWQDDWYKSSRNTAKVSDVDRTAYWSDYSAPEQSMGLLAMDPGTDGSLCAVDGRFLEWTKKDMVAKHEDGTSIFAKCDERFLYLCVQKSDLAFDDNVYYLPMDITPKSGSNYCENFDVKFDRAVDFLLVIDGKENTYLTVQERYEVLRAVSAQEAYGFDTYAAGNIPEKDSPEFREIETLVQVKLSDNGVEYERFEAGRFSYGSTDPDSEQFDSQADFCVGEGIFEIRIPWYLLNFRDPSLMRIHDDYYENYGVDHLAISKIYFGFGDGADGARIKLSPLKLSGWGENVTYHERLKESYYILQSVWNED